MRFDLPDERVLFLGEEIVQKKLLARSNAIQHLIAQEVVIAHGERCASFFCESAEEGDVRHNSRQSYLLDGQM